MKARQSKGFNFEGQDLFIGIDVHLRTWNVSILTASGFLERYSQLASDEKLFEHLVKKYPSATYHAVYESGFSGFSTYYALTKYGISCTIAHAITNKNFVRYAVEYVQSSSPRVIVCYQNSPKPIQK